MSMRKEWAKGHGRQWQIQQNILVKVNRGKATGFSIPRLFFLIQRDKFL